MTARVDFSLRYPALINDTIQAQFMREGLEGVLDHDWQNSGTLLPVMASEDFSYYLEKVPGAFALVGAGENSSSVPCRNACYDFNDRLIEPMVRLIVRLAGLSVP